MKNIYIHGELGVKFGKKWTLDVRTPSEAIRAIFSNDPEIEKYIYERESKGIYYGIKKQGSQVFTTIKESALQTDKDFHIFPQAHGGSGFVFSLVSMAVTTAASMYVSKKMAEAMERDDETIATQTESFLYEGSSNRYKQGAVVPVGYGNLKVGSSVISSCVINYDYNSEFQKINIFQDGLYSLMPNYHKYYDLQLGPLYSSFALNLFDGSSRSRFVDPAYQYIVELDASIEFGSNDGLYGGFEPISSQRERFTSLPAKKGNAIGGYYYYTYNFFKGITPSFLEKINTSGGNWWADTKFIEIEGLRGAVKESDAILSSIVCLQSLPVVIEDETEKIFYPISFASQDLEYLKADKERDRRGQFPIEVGERWRQGKKENGVGWFKLESASISKTVDLICEGPIEGFSSKEGEPIPFSAIPQDPKGEIAPSRNNSDDYLRGVFLDGVAVKEVNRDTNLDGYNINEFDIDVGRDDDNNIGSDDQNLLEPQYLFTAHTVDIGKQLFGPRTINWSDHSSLLQVEPFAINSLYSRNEYVSFEGNIYFVSVPLDELYESGGDYQYDEDPGNNSIIHTKGEEEGALPVFYRASAAMDDYKLFIGEDTFQDLKEARYKEGDKVRSKKSDGNMGYYEMGLDSHKFLGIYDETVNYGDKQGYILMQESIQGGPNSNAPIFLITGDGAKVGDPLQSIASGISMRVDEFNDRTLDPVYMLSNYQDIDGVNEAGQVVVESIDYTIQPPVSSTEATIDFPQSIVSEVDIEPGGPIDIRDELWEKITITSPLDIKRGEEDITDEVGIFLARTSSELDSLLEKRFSEENYIAHTVINPLVEECYVSLQVDELGYIYQGDEVEVEYKIGKLWTFLLLAMGIYQIFKATQESASSVTYGIGVGAMETTFSLSAPPTGTPQGGAIAGITSGVWAARATSHTAGAVAAGVLGGVLTVILSFVLASHRFSVGTKIENSGELWPNKARFRIKYGNEGEENYETDIFIYGVATSPYRKDVKIYFPPNPNQRDRMVKVYKLNRERNPVQEGEQAARYKESMSLASITEITPAVMSYPNSVVIGTRVNSKDMPSIPTREYNLRLKKMKVPSNYDTETRTYDGNWDGVFKDEDYWTDNPAWCLYDLISNKRFGIGRFGIKEENIDKWTIYRMSKYCDELVASGYSSKYKKRNFTSITPEEGEEDENEIFISEDVNLLEFKIEFNHIGKKLAIFHEDGSYESIRIIDFIRDGKKLKLESKPRFPAFLCACEIDYPILEPRYTLNAFLMNKQNAFKLINEFALIFRSFAYWSGGAINFFQDQKKDAVMLFSNNNISKDGFSYSSTPKTSRTNSCNIRYLDRHNNYRSKIEHSEDRNAINKNNIIEQTIDGFGITSQSQAKRASEFVIKSANLETEILSFTTSMPGSYLRPGDVIDVVDNKRTIGRFAGKVIDIKVHPRGKMAELTLDYPINTIIDNYDKKTWKNICLYQPTGNETIESLNSLGKVKDQKIEDMRISQIGNYLIYDISEDNKKIKLYNDCYSFVEGDFSWTEATRHAEASSGKLATIENKDDQILMRANLPNDAVAWLGGYNREEPAPEKLIWHNASECGDGDITYKDWAPGYPRFSDPIEKEEDESEDETSVLVTDLNDHLISADPNIENQLGNYIATSGTIDKKNHGEWIHMSGSIRNNYMLEKDSDDSLEKIVDSAGTSFVIEDSTNLALRSQYKILNIAEESNGVFKIQAMQYNKSKFDNIEKSNSITKPTGPIII